MKRNLEVEDPEHSGIPEQVLVIPRCYHDDIPTCDSNGIVVPANIICGVVDAKYLGLDDCVCIGELDGISLLSSEAVLVTIVVQS